MIRVTSVALWCDVVNIMDNREKELTLQWLQTRAYVPPLPRVVPVNGADSLETYFNPGCRHGRTSYDIANCGACIEHTKKIKAFRAGAKEATE